MNEIYITGSSNFINQTVYLLENNYNLTLDCSGTNDHKCSATICKWKRGSKIIFPSSHYVITNSSMIIVNLTTVDAGHYQCIIYESVEKQITVNTIQVIIKGIAI